MNFLNTKNESPNYDFTLTKVKYLINSTFLNPINISLMWKFIDHLNDRFKQLSVNIPILNDLHWK
jgi:hypothetical protein